MVLDARAQVVNRTISGARGQYRVLRPESAVELRVLRLGFRPRTVPLPRALTVSTEVNVTLATVARALDAVDVVAARGCPVRRDRAEAFGLLDQARAGLLATVVARERQSAAMRVVRYERWLDLDGVSVERQTVRLDSTAGATISFNAVQSAVDFVDRGFRVGTNGQYTYFGPDADVLLDARFQGGYCFSLADADTSRPTQRGLRFTPASRQRGRVDIEGTLWIDTAQRVLKDLEFLYVGVERLAESFAAGGHVGFQAMPNGVSFIDRWTLRLVGAADTIVTDAGATSQDYAIREVGGEVASAHWSDSTTFVSSLSTVHVTATTSEGGPAAFARLKFADTDYHTVTDSLGRASVPFVLPGRYRVLVADPRLDAISLDLPVERRIPVQRAAATIARVVIPTVEQFVAPLCGRDSLLRTDAWLLARVVGSNGEPLADASYRISDRADGDWRVISQGGLTSSSGLLAFCRILTRGAEVEIAAWRRNGPVTRVRGSMDRAISIMRVVVPTTPIVSSRESGRDDAPVLLSGIVMDSVRKEPVADARVMLLGTPLEGSTDETGRFVIGGVARGVHRIEVSSPWLDSIGAVSRRTVSVQDSTPITLYLPDVGDVIKATCGSRETSGVLVGRITTRDRAALPQGLRVVAEWAPPPPDGARPAPGDTNRVAYGIIDPTGTFRVCGVPADAPVLVRAEAEGLAAQPGARQAVIISEDRRFARADLALESTGITGAVFIGVVADSSGRALANADVTLTDIGQSARADERGVFRLEGVPAGAHVVTVRQVGYAPSIVTLDFRTGRTVEQHFALTRATALKAVEVNADGAPVGFEERRRSGTGVFLGRADLEKHRGRRLGEVASQVRAFGQAAGGGAHSYLVGKRAPIRIPPRTSTSGDPFCGQGGASSNCTFTVDGLRGQGYYCPTQAEQRNGILSCACFARVYIDDQLMNSGRPTEPFDISTIAVDDLAAVEFYGTAVSIPSRYQALQSNCGVLLVWTRR
jgi:hypothetical protein